MPRIRERTLTLLVLGVLAVMLITTFLGIGAVSRLAPSQPPATGYASTEKGNVTVTLYDTISITTQDSDTIDFGGCTAGGIIWSNEAGGGNDTPCASYEPGSIILRNDGNTPANISFNVSAWGEAHGGRLLDATTDDSWIAYRLSNSTINGNYSGGCYSRLQANWTNITGGGQQRGCDLLLPDSTNNSVSLDFAFYVPPTTENGENDIAVSFVAKVPS